MGTLAPMFTTPTFTTATIVDVLNYINYLSGGIFLPMIIAAMWIITFSWVHQTNGKIKGFQYASWFTFVVTALMVVARTSTGAQLLPTQTIVPPLVFTAIGGWIAFKNRGRYQ